MNNIYFMVIRYNGLNDVVFNYITDIISKGTVCVKGVFFINWNESEKEEKLLDLYDHVKDNEEAVKNILSINDAIMVGVVLYDSAPVSPPPGEKVSGKNWNMVCLKRYIRGKFGNVVHISDSTPNTFIEINKLTGLKEYQVIGIVNNDGVTIQNVSTNNELAERFNKIKSGAEVLWSPDK